MSARETAPSRGGPKRSAPREEGAGAAKSSTVSSKAPRWPLRVADRPLHHREIPHPLRHDLRRPGEQHGHVEPVGEPAAGLDRGLVAAVDQHHALARERHDRRRRRPAARRPSPSAPPPWGRRPRPRRSSPPVSRMFAKASSPAKPRSSATSVKSGACCVQPIVTALGARQHRPHPVELGAAELVARIRPPPPDTRGRRSSP